MLTNSDIRFLPSHSVPSAPTPESASFVQDLANRIEGSGALEDGLRRQLRALREEADPQLLGESILQIAAQMERAERPDLAHAIYADLQRAPAEVLAPVASRIESRARSLENGGGWDEKLGRLAGSLARAAWDPANILGFGIAGLAAKATKVFLLGRTLSRSVSLARNLTSVGLAGAASFGVETLAFTSTARAYHRFVGDRPTESFGQELASSAIFMGAMRMSGLATKPFVNGALSRAVVPHLSSIAGIAGAHYLEESVGLRPETQGSQRWIDVLGTWLHLQAGQLGARLLLPASFHAAERRLNDRVTELSNAAWRRIDASPWMQTAKRRGTELLLAPASLLLSVGSGGGKISSQATTTPGPIPGRGDNLIQEFVEISRGSPLKALQISQAEIIPITMANKDAIYRGLQGYFQEQANKRASRSKIFIVSDRTVTQVTVKQMATAIRGIVNRAAPDDANLDRSSLFATGVVFPTLNPRLEDPSIKNVLFFDWNGKPIEFLLSRSALAMINERLKAQATIAPPSIGQLPVALEPARPLEPIAPFVPRNTPSQPIEVVPAPQPSIEMQLFPKVTGLSIGDVDPKTPMGRIANFSGADPVRTVQDLFRRRLDENNSSFVLTVGMNHLETEIEVWVRGMLETLQSAHKAKPIPRSSLFTLVMLNRGKGINFLQKMGRYIAEPTFVSKAQDMLVENSMVYASYSRPIAAETSAQNRSTPLVTNVQGIFDAIANSLMQGVALRVHYHGLWTQARIENIQQVLVKQIKKMPNGSEARDFQIRVTDTGTNTERIANFHWDGTQVTYSISGAPHSG